MAWEPDRYLLFADHRLRPGLELMARIPDVDARRIVDLGSGTGQLTALLADRWPGAAVEGIDSSPEMVDRARREYGGGTEWVLADIDGWEPDGPVDVLYSNAALHWLDDHEGLFERLRSYLAPGGVLAVQVPDNWSEPTHRVPAAILDGGAWGARAVGALMRDRLAAPANYRAWVQPGEVDLWRTTYHQLLTGDDPVWTWVTGSLLRPVLDALEVPERERFAALAKARYAEAYPAAGDGTTVLPFSRLFLVVRAP